MSLRSSLSFDSFEPTFEPPQHLSEEKNPSRRRRRQESNSAFELLDSLRHSLSGSSFRTAPLNKSHTQGSEGFSVKEIYGDLNDEDINLRRSATRNTILDSLQERVERTLTPRHLDPEYKGEELEEGDEESSRLYEKLPDTSVPSKDFGGEFTGIDPELVSWDGPDDPENPRNWSRANKLFQTALVSTYSLISPMSSSMLSPAMNEISESLGIKKPVIKSLCVSIMILAWAIGPLIIAPMSESDRVGRKPVLNFSIWIVAAFNLACGFAKTPTQLCVMRFLGGLGGCAPLNVGAGTLADLWPDSQRQAAMAAYSLGPTLGPVIAPVISSFIVTGLSWHWCFFILAIFNFAVAAFGTFLFKETYAPKILRNKAIKLRSQTGNIHLHTIYEIADGESTGSRLLTTISRPISLIVGHPMVFGLGLYMAFVYGFMYLMIVTFPTVFKGDYGMSTNIAGLMYLPLGIGYILGTLFFRYAIDLAYRRLTKRNGGVAKPEYRLPCLVCGGIGIPAGLIIYGWSAENKIHWIVPSIGMCIFGFTLVAVFQSIQNYLIDMNNRFAASSVAAAAVFRSCFGFSFPLFAPAMYDKLHYGWGNTMCALIAIALGIPFPLFCLFYGERLRLWANSRFDRKQAIKDSKNLEKLKKRNEKEYIRSLEKKEKKESSDQSERIEMKDTPEVKV
ncbi:hypothetical protein JCM33374_g163 [Metschnikowia sp. JCM 33374]|nr:hypothetical protein JCM33374_g163 [Metschnikowia sp. JCM 33374]